MSSRELAQAERAELVTLLEQDRDQRIADIMAEDPEYKPRIENRKRKIALGKLRVEKEVERLEALEVQINDLKAERDNLQEKINRKMPLIKKKGKKRSWETDDNDTCARRADLCEAVEEIMSQVHENVVEKDPTGKKVRAAEKAHLGRLKVLHQCKTRDDIESKQLFA